MPEPAPPGGHRTAGLRAARAYARREQAELAELIGVSIRDYRRIEAGEKQLDADQRAAIAEACNVPIWLVNNGLARAIREDGAVTDRVARLEGLATQNAASEEELRKLMARVQILEEEAKPRTGARSRTSKGRGQ